MPKTKAEIQAKFNRDMNRSSPNPRYGGLTPTQALQAQRKAKSDSETERELQLST